MIQPLDSKQRTNWSTGLMGEKSPLRWQSSLLHSVVT